MSEITTQTDRDTKTGRFLAGNSGNGGRRPGSRGKLSEQFLLDLRDLWDRRGVEVLERVADEDPAALLRAISGLLPRDVRIDLGLDAASFAQTFEAALGMLGNAVPRQTRRPLPGQRQRPVIEHER